MEVGGWRLEDLRILGRFELYRIQDFRLAREFGLAGWKFVDTEDVGQYIGRLLAAQRRRFVEWHALPHALEHVAERHAIPIAAERCSLQRPGACSTAHERRPMALHALLEIDRLPAIRLRFGVN